MDYSVNMTAATPFRKARAVNYTTNGYPTRIPTLVEPTTVDPGTATGQFAIDLAAFPTGTAFAHALVLPFGAGADTNTFSVRFLGWKAIETSQTDRVWVPVHLGELTCTLSLLVGVAGGAVVATDRFCDTLAIAKEPTITADTTRQGTITLYAPANDTIAFALVPLYGCQKLELAFTTGGSATSANALLALL